ncbi:MAG: hypothetical protein E7346_01580 [Clostridiales bacterium]|nr:hypothetical protein [Clostridiales bacterium]MBQ3046686.1 hypothetical protein [Clostridia bacterium]
MKKIFKFFANFCVIVFSCSSFCGCHRNTDWAQPPINQYAEHTHKEKAYGDGSYGYFRRKYESVYNEEEHIQRIAEQFKESSLFDVRAGEYEVYILYSFQENPEYFLIQTYSWDDGEPFCYYVGHVENDEYYIFNLSRVVKFYEEGKEGIGLDGNRICVGENFYSKAGVINARKYYGCMGMFAWELEESTFKNSKERRIFHYLTTAPSGDTLYIDNQIVEMSEEVYEQYKKCTYVRGVKKSLLELAKNN